MHSSPSALKSYWLAARPKTWIASISPVAIGTVLAAQKTSIDSMMLAATMCFALLIQIGTNFANDAFDYLKGADTEERKGPARAVQQGWISVQAMFRATAAVFIAAFLVSLPLIAAAGLWNIFSVILCVALGIFYTGGPRPLGYFGLGEALVFVFFGPIATCGTYYLQTMTVDGQIFFASLSPGLLSCSLIVANNLRDAETDAKANKQTLVVRFGELFGRAEYVVCIAIASLVPLLLVLGGAPSKVGLASLIFPLSLPALKRALISNDFVPLLQASGILLWAYTALFCLGCVV